MKKILLIFVLLITSCYKDLDLPTTPLILCFPQGKPWAVEQLLIDGQDKTSLFRGFNMWFYNPPASDPNFGRIETYVVNGTWLYEDINGREYLNINLSPNTYTRPATISPFLKINNRWEIQDKWSNRIIMRDIDGNILKIRVAR